MTSRWSHCRIMVISHKNFGFAVSLPSEVLRGPKPQQHNSVAASHLLYQHFIWACLFDQSIFVWLRFTKKNKTLKKKTAINLPDIRKNSSPSIFGLALPPFFGTDGQSLVRSFFQWLLCMICFSVFIRD